MFFYYIGLYFALIVYSPLFRDTPPLLIHWHIKYFYKKGFYFTKFIHIYIVRTISVFIYYISNQISDCDWFFRRQRIYIHWISKKICLSLQCTDATLLKWFDRPLVMLGFVWITMALQNGLVDMSYVANIVCGKCRNRFYIWIWRLAKAPSCCCCIFLLLFMKNII